MIIQYKLPVKESSENVYSVSVRGAAEAGEGGPRGRRTGL